MSASTRAIQQPMGHGSTFGAVAIGVATLLAVGAIAWGTLNLTANKQATTTVQAGPALMDSPIGKLAPLAATYVAPKAGNTTPRFDIVSQASGTAAHGYVSAAAAAAQNSAHAAPLVDRNAENVVSGRGRANRPS